MNRLLSLFFVGALFFFTACDAVPVRFDIDVDATTTVEKGSILDQRSSTFGFSNFTTFDVSSTQEFQNNNTQKNQVVDAKIAKLTLTIVSPSGQNFDFLDKLSFYIEAPGLEKKLVATKDFAKGLTTVDMDIIDLDLAPYIKADSFSFTTDVTGRRPDVETQIKASLKLNIGAKL